MRSTVSTARPHLVLQAHRCTPVQRHRKQLQQRVACSSSDDVQQTTARSEKSITDLSALESQMRSRKKPKQKGPKVVAPVVEQVYGKGPKSAEAVMETRVVGALFVMFSIILLEGIFLAASGFLPEAADQFAQDVVYPAFSPSLGVFLAGSTAYGLWKSRQSN